MPSKQKKVRFETEYNSSFKAFDTDAYKSPLIEALLPKASIENVDISEKAAGLESQKFLKPNEPPFQHKKTKVKGQVRQKIEDRMTHVNTVNNVDKEKHPDEMNNAKTNKALKFKAGLKPVVTQTEQRKHPVSEYQKQFEWKNAANDSPVLNAEKVVFDSHTNIPRFVPGKVTHKTEYQSKFDAQKKRIGRKDDKEENLEDEGDDRESPSSAVKRFLQTSQNPDVPFFPHGSNRIYHSEYKSNFGSPKNYKYKEGMWLGAKPPHLLPDEETPRSLDQTITNWFEEVLELREKARQYKSRAIEGNYFSRDFLDKLDEELEQIDLEQDRPENKNSKKYSLVKYAWGSSAKNDKSTSTDGLRNAVQRETSENESKSGSDSGDMSSSTDDNKSETSYTRRFLPGQDGVSNEKRNLGKTYTRFKPMLPKANRFQQDKVDKSPELDQAHDATSGSEASSEDSENNNNEDIIHKTRSKQHATPENIQDKFDIGRIPCIGSNDNGILGSLGSSVQSLDGSNSESYTKKYLDSDCSSVSSYLSSQSLARETLSRASKRNTEFWKKTR